MTCLVVREGFLVEETLGSVCRIHPPDLIGRDITNTGNGKEEAQRWPWEGTMGSCQVWSLHVG